MLKQFVKENGTFHVPLSCPLLGRWIQFQRLQYRLFQEGKPNSITQARIDRLNELGFIWNIHEVNWDARYQELEEFYKEHGHSIIPKLRDSSLGIWLQSQRNNYHLFIEGKPSGMTKERVARLEALDFCWDAREALWFERFNELQEYREIHGDCLVPKLLPENPQLGLWTHTQRSQYRLWKAGKSTWLTKERIDMLEALGFEWSAHDAAWTRNYNLLVEVIAGKRRLPKNLVGWITRQRQQYRKKLKGGKTPLTDERIAKLKKIGQL